MTPTLRHQRRRLWCLCAIVMNGERRTSVQLGRAHVRLLVSIRCHLKLFFRPTASFRFVVGHVVAKNGCNVVGNRAMSTWSTPVARYCTFARTRRRTGKRSRPYFSSSPGTMSAKDGLSAIVALTVYLVGRNILHTHPSRRLGRRACLPSRGAPMCCLLCDLFTNGGNSTVGTREGYTMDGCEVP